MPTESEVAEAQRSLIQDAVQLGDLDKNIEALATDCDQQVHLVMEETGPDITRLRALIKEHQDDIEAIEEQNETRIAAIKKRWKEITEALQTKRKRIQVSFDIQLSLLAPVRKLPSELLFNIFEHFVRDGGSPWTLALVSVAWRKVMFSICSLWSTIDVGIDTKSLKRVEAHLRRSGTHSLLDLRLSFHPHKKHRTPTKKQVLKACKLIGGSDMLARWGSVTLIRPPYMLVQQELEPFFAHPLPNLHSLSVEPQNSDVLLNILLKMIDTSAKAFRILSVNEQSLSDLRAYPNTLKHVEVFRCRDNGRDQFWNQPVFKCLSFMRSLKEIELPGSIVPEYETPVWMRSVQNATFYRLDIKLFDFQMEHQKEYLLNLRQLTLSHCFSPHYRDLRIKTPNLRVLKVVEDFAVTPCFDTPILDDLCLISHRRTWTRVSEEREYGDLKGLLDLSFGAPKTRHLQLENMAPVAGIIIFLKKMPELERLTILEAPAATLSYGLFAALKEVVEDVLRADGPSQSKMALCPTLQSLTIKAQPPGLFTSERQAQLSKWVTEVVNVRRNSGETFEGVVVFGNESIFVDEAQS